MADYIIQDEDYNLRWFSKFKDRHDNPFRVNIYERGFADNSEKEIKIYSTSPVTLNYRTLSKDNLHQSIIPSEVFYNFFVTGNTAQFNSLLEAQYQDHLLELAGPGWREFFPQLSTFVNRGSGTSWTISGATNIPVVEFTFAGALSPWINTGGASLSTWTWNSTGQSATVTTVNSFGCKTLRLSGVTVNHYAPDAPATAMRITIDYEFPIVSNSSSLSISFIARNSGNTQLFNDTFSGSGAGTKVLWMPSNVQNIDHYLITVNSTGFVAGDVIKIKNIKLEAHTRATVILTPTNTSKQLVYSASTSNILEAGDKIYVNVMHHSVDTAGSGIHQLYFRMYNSAGTQVHSQLLSNNSPGTYQHDFRVTATTTTRYWGFVVVADTATSSGLNMWIEENELGMLVTKRDTNVTKWLGWVQPQNLSASVTDNGGYFLQVNAQDGLLDLQEIEFPYKIEMTLGLRSQLQNVKDCLRVNNIPALPIQVQDNTTEATMAAPIIDKVRMNPRRFIKIDDGRITFRNGYECLTMMHAPFHQRLAQSNAKWKIWNELEQTSDRHNYTFDSLNLYETNTNYSRIITLPDSQKFIRSTDELTKIEPIKYAQTTFRNLNSGKPIPESTINGSFRYGNIIGWGSGVSSEAITVAYASKDGIDSLEAHSIYPINFDPDARQTVVEEFANTGIGGEGAFNLNSSSGSTITVGFNVLLDKVVFDTGNHKLPIFKIELWYDDGISAPSKVDEVEKQWVSGETTSYIVSLRYQDTGLHFLKFSTVKNLTSSYTELRYYLSGIWIFYNYDDSLSFDKFYLSNEVPLTRAVRVEESELYFGDGANFYDAGGILNPLSGLTTSWTSANSGAIYSGVPLMEAFNISRLKMNERFRNYITITLTDTENSLQDLAIDSILYFEVHGNNAPYQIMGMVFDVINNHYTLDLAQLMDDAITVATDKTDLRTSDGNPLNQE